MDTRFNGTRRGPGDKCQAKLPSSKQANAAASLAKAISKSVNPKEAYDAIESARILGEITLEQAVQLHAA